MLQEACYKFCRQLVLEALTTARHGELRVIMPGGARRLFGGLGKELQAIITIKNENFYWRYVLYGALGLAESYLHDEWETPHLTQAISWFVLNSEAVTAPAVPRHRGRKIDLLKNFKRIRYPAYSNNNKKRRRDRIKDPYKGKTDFFQTWLGPTLAYSAGYYTASDDTLGQAQIAKWEKICEKLQLGPHDYLLEIGCGWGGFAIHVAKKYRCRIQAVTISEEQFREAAHRVEEAGVADLVDIVFCDYRDLSGRFDKIVCIEMVQTIGNSYIESFFAKIEELLAPRGMLLLQATLCSDNEYPALRDSIDFVQKYIDPGSLVMSLRRLTEALNETGNLTLLDYEDMTASAARTVLEWKKLFTSGVAELRRQRQDTLFLKKWFYYLSYLEATLAIRHHSVAQLLYVRPHNLELKTPLYSLP